MSSPPAAARQRDINYLSGAQTNTSNDAVVTYSKTKEKSQLPLILLPKWRPAEQNKVSGEPKNYLKAENHKAGIEICYFPDTLFVFPWWITGCWGKKTTHCSVDIDLI